MLDIGWSEMALIAFVALIIFGPKDLPQVLRSVTHWVRKARGLAREFQSGVDEMIREADLADAKKLIDGGTNLDIDKIVENAIDPTGGLREEARDLEVTARADPTASVVGAQEKAAVETLGEANGAPDAAAEGAVAETAKATIIDHPAQVAPPDSLTPPREPGEEEAPPPDADSSQKADNSQKRA